MRCGVKYYSIEIIQGLGVGGDILLQEASLEMLRVRLCAAVSMQCSVKIIMMQEVRVNDRTLGSSIHPPTRPDSGGPCRTFRGHRGTRPGP